MAKSKKIVLIVIGGLVAVCALWYFFVWQRTPLQQGERYLAEMEKKYREDAYGGATPEETLRLFIDALKAGDTELASKYFVVEKWEEWKDYFDRNNLENIINEAQKLKLSKKNDKEAFFVIVNERNIVEVQVLFNKNPFTNKWKIESL